MIHGIDTKPGPAAAGAVEGDKAKGPHARDLDTASREFEGMFVKQILKGVVPTGGGEVYAGMATDALATAVTAGKGTGLGELIRHALESSENKFKFGG